MKISDISFVSATRQVDKNKQKNSNVKFGEAQLNMYAMSDNHFQVSSMPNLAQTFLNNAKDIFPSASTQGDGKDTKNVVLFNGDWFMDPGRQDFVTHQDKTAGDCEYQYLTTFIDMVQSEITKLKGGNETNFEALFVVGNHDLDGGDRMLFSFLTKAKNLATVVTNACKFSPLFCELEASREKEIRKFDKLAKQEKENKLKEADRKELENLKNLLGDDGKQGGVIEEAHIINLPDNKNKELLNKVLFLGVTIPGLDFYCPGKIKETAFYNKTDKKDAKITEKDLIETYEKLNRVIEKFKTDNPNGVVLIGSHAGRPVSKMLVKNVNGITAVINGHDHKFEEVLINKKEGDSTRTIPIYSFGDDNKISRSLKFHFNDKGELDSTDTKTYPTVGDKDVKADNPFLKIKEDLFKEDLKPRYTIKLPEEAEKKDENKNIKQLTDKKIRVENNLQANSVTDWILAEINKFEEKEGKPKSQIFGVPSSAFRQKLDLSRGKDINSPKVSHMEFRNILIGQTLDLSEIKTDKINGGLIGEMIIENMVDHSKDQSRNTLVQWSGMSVNKTAFMNIIDNYVIETKKKRKDVKPEEIKKYIASKVANKNLDMDSLIKIKDENGVYQNIDPKKEYNIALLSYFFMRKKLDTAMRLGEEGKFQNTISENGKILPMDDLLRKYADEHDRVLVTADPAEKRIL
jgi:hypothetical protein